MKTFQTFKTVSLILCFTCRAVDAQSQAEINDDALAGLKQADSRLNESYRKLLDSQDNDPSFATVLKNAQRAWLKYVDLHMEATFPLIEGEDPREVYGSAYPSEYAMEKVKLFEQRIRLLNDQLGEAIETENPGAAVGGSSSGLASHPSRIRESPEAVDARYGGPVFSHAEGGLRYSEYLFKGKSITVVFKDGKSSVFYITLPFSKVQTEAQGVEAIKFPEFAYSMLKNLFGFDDADFKSLQESKRDEGYETYYTHESGGVSVTLRTNPGALQMTDIFMGYLRVCDAKQMDEASVSERSKFIDRAIAAKREGKERSQVDGF